MELKPNRGTYRPHQCALLIVPYGIETIMSKDLKKVLNGLLIVPYGIETSLA